MATICGQNILYMLLLICLIKIFLKNDRHLINQNVIIIFIVFIVIFINKPINFKTTFIKINEDNDDHNEDDEQILVN